jgi:type I restriction enzyme, S subunit
MFREVITTAHPTGWTDGCLDDVIAEIVAGTSVNCEERDFQPGDKSVLKLSAVAHGRLDSKETKIAARSEHARLRTPVRPGTVLFTRKNTPDLVGDSAYVSDNLQDVFLPDLIWELSVESKCDPRWLNHWLQSPAFRRQMPSIAAGSSQSMVGIAQSSLLESPVLIPPYTEQQRIATVLNVWDQAIDQVDRLLAAKHRRFREARIRLIEAYQVGGAQNNGWRQLGFGEITEELKRRNTKKLAANRVMGVIKGEGLIPMRSHVMASDLSRYLTVPADAFAYNPMRINIGSIAKSTYDDDVLVSPDYVVFQAREGVASPDFLNFFIGTKRWRDHLIVVGSGSVRTRIYFDGLSELVLRAPGIDEQKRIGTILSDLKKDVELTADAVEGLRKQKLGLMQKLLTGQWRVDQCPDPPSTATGLASK